LANKRLTWSGILAREEEQLRRDEWQCKDYADGWIDYQSWDDARKYQEETGARIRLKPIS